MSAEILTTKDIVVNVAVQFINLGIFLFIFYKLFAKNIVKGLEERNHLLDKIKNVQEEYDGLLKKANDEADSIITDATHHKNKILDEAKLSAENFKKTIISDAERKADDLLNKAKKDGENIQKDLVENWENGVKSTAKVIVKKLLGTDSNLQDQYLENLLKEVKQSK